MKKLFSYYTAALLLLVILLAIILATFRDYGIAWDEPWHLNYGSLLVDYYRGAAAAEPGLNALSYRNLYLYGGAFDLSAALLSRLLAVFFPLPEIELHHLLIALIGLFGLVGTWASARLLGGDRAAFWAAALLTTTPLYYGHIFFNPKDIPFAAGSIWSLFFLLSIIQAFPQIRWGRLAAFGATAGITMGIRVGGVLLVGYLLLFLLVNFVQVYRHDRTALWPKFWRLVILPSALGGGLAWMVMVLFWPYAQLNPIRYPLRTLLQASEFDFPYEVLFKGRLIPAVAAPLDYIPTYLGILLPELFLLLLLAALILGVRRSVHLIRSRQELHFPFSGAVLLALAAGLPVLVAVLVRSTLYDGLRHFIFILPPLACLAGWAWHSVLERLERRSFGLAAALTLIAALLLVLQSYQMVRLHPYEYAYYNQLVGGLPGAASRFETDFWGTAASAAAKALVEAVNQSSGGSTEKIKVFVSGANPYSVEIYLPARFEITADITQADFLIGGIRGFALNSLPGRQFLAVTRLGVPLAVVKAR